MTDFLPTRHFAIEVDYETFLGVHNYTRNYLILKTDKELQRGDLLQLNYTDSDGDHSQLLCQITHVTGANHRAIAKGWVVVAVDQTREENILNEDEENVGIFETVGQTYVN